MPSRPEWDTYFLSLAQVVATRSPDTTQHGCVIVDAQRRIVSTGYNGPVRGLIDDLVPRTRPEKYDWMIHAEDNAVLFAREDLRGATAYVTGHPCAACCRRLLQVGVRRIVCGDRFSQCVTAEERAACAEMCSQLDVRLEVRGERKEMT